MGRAPCCEKMGLKKGPWTFEEDHILISYIQQHGHGNWRALPKQAGLLRCGKSCRLRWTNYLRPDIKRGNFSKEEEETIINLHQMLGNRWSTIAAKLPGRTDNEIKNVWHTHLKKRLKNINQKFDSNSPTSKPEIECHGPAPGSPQHSSSELSSVTDIDSSAMSMETNNIFLKNEEMDSFENFCELDESFWSEEILLSPVNISTETYMDTTQSGNIDNGVDFWYNVFIRSDGELPEF